MVLYLCNNQNINLFDFLDREKGMSIKKMSGIFKLKQFVIHDVRNLSQFRFFIIDLKALKDNEIEIVEAITAFGIMYSARIILFAEGFDGDSSLITKLIELGIYNIITSKEFEEIKEEMLECTSSDGKDIRSAIRSKYFSLEEIMEKKTEYSFLCRNIKIAVVGAVHKVGTSTIAINLVNFLFNAGAKVDYVEANNNEHLKWLPRYYKDMSVNEAYIEYKGAKYYFSGNFPEENNFTVIDFGSIDQCRLQALKQCELIILCGTSKPYEIDFVRVAVEEIGGIPLNIVMSHTPKKTQIDIADMFKDNACLYFSEYSPDLFNGKANEIIFGEIVKAYMQAYND